MATRARITLFSLTVDIVKAPILKAKLHLPYVPEGHLREEPLLGQL